jgi:hypothetical protein
MWCGWHAYICIYVVGGDTPCSCSDLTKESVLCAPRDCCDRWAMMHVGCCGVSGDSERLTGLSLSLSLSVSLSASLSLCLFVSPSPCLSVSRSVSLSLWFSVSMSLCLYVSLSACLSVSLPVCLSVSLSLCLTLYVCLSLCLSLSRAHSVCFVPLTCTAFWLKLDRRKSQREVCVRGLGIQCRSSEEVKVFRFDNRDVCP